MKKSLLLLVFIASIKLTFAQDATVTIVRHKMYTGQAGPLKVFIDGKLVCQVNDNSYTTHSLSEGKHTIAVQYNGKTLSKKAESFAVNVKQGNAYYVRAFKEGIAQTLRLEEVTESTWNDLQQDLKKDDCL